MFHAGVVLSKAGELEGQKVLFALVMGVARSDGNLQNPREQIIKRRGKAL